MDINPTILKKLDEHTVSDPEMRQFITEILSLDDDASSRYKEKYRSLIKSHVAKEGYE